jgi:periplasmic protein TonB
VSEPHAIPNATLVIPHATHVILSEVAINPVSPVRYPPALLAQGIEGRVLLRLYVDSAGNVNPDSIRIAESSGYPALDSAALVGAPELRYSPALHQGRPIAAPFLQPVQFRGPRSRSAAP